MWDFFGSDEGQLQPRQPPAVPTQDPGATEILLREYHRALDTHDRYYDFIIRATAIGLSAISGLLYIVFEKGVKLHEWAYWLAPLLPIMIYAIIIMFIYRIILMSFYIRDIEERISDVANDQKIDFIHMENVFAHGLSSPKTGIPSFLSTYFLLFIFAAALYITVIVLSLSHISSLGATNFQKISFISFNICVTIIFFWSIVSSVTGLRTVYNKFMKNDIDESSDVNHRLVILKYMIIPIIFDLLKTLVTLL